MLLNKGKISWILPTKEGLAKVDDLKKSDIFPPQITQAAFILNKKNRENNKDKTQLPLTIDEGIDYFSDLKLKDYRKDPIENTNEEILRFEDIDFTYNTIKGQAKIIFDKLNLSIKRGDKIALIGSNGAGKSTIMKLLVGLNKAKAGKIFFKDKDIKKIPEEELAKYISLVYQNPEEMFIKDSIYEDIAFAMKEREVEDYKAQTSRLINRFRLSDLKDRDGRLLSGGQMRRASVAIGIALKPEVLLLDEPTGNLDMATRTEIIKVLEEIKDETETVIIASHDMQLVSQWADRVIVLHGGKIIADKPKDQIFDNDLVKETIAIRAPEIFDLAQAINPKTYVYTVEEFLENIENNLKEDHYED